MGEISPWTKLGYWMNLIYTFPVAVLVGGVGGWWLDGKLGTSPLLVVLGFIVGLGAGFLLLFRTVKMVEKKNGAEGRRGKGA